MVLNISFGANYNGGIAKKPDSKNSKLFTFEPPRTTVYGDEYRNIEDYCASMGIDFSKISLSAIQQKIKQPKEGINLVQINFDKLLQIAQNQQSDIYVCGYS